MAGVDAHGLFAGQQRIHDIAVGAQHVRTQDVQIDPFRRFGEPRGDGLQCFGGPFELAERARQHVVSLGILGILRDGEAGFAQRFFMAAQLGRSASKVEAGGHSGGFQLTHYSAGPYAVTTTQTVRGLARGDYTLSVWVRRSTGKNASAITLACGGFPQTTRLPALPGAWLR